MEDLQTKFDQMFFENKHFSKKYKNPKTAIVYLDTDQKQRAKNIQKVFKNKKIKPCDDMNKFCCQFDQQKNLLQYLQTFQKRIDLYQIKDQQQKEYLQIFEKINSGYWNNFMYLHSQKDHLNHQNGNKFENGIPQDQKIQQIYYIQKVFPKQKIAIINFDTAQDKIQNLELKNNKRLLQISVNKFYQNNASEKSKVNLYEQKYNLKMHIMKDDSFYVGDSDIIYIFERAVFPILRKYKPQFVLINCDFNYLNKKQFINQDITRDSFMYILYNIKQYISDKVGVVIENSSNLEQRSISILGLISILRGDSFPNQFMIKKLTKKMFVKNMRPQQKFFEEVEQQISKWSQFWSCVNKDKYTKIKQKVQKKLIIGRQFADGHWKRLKIEHDNFYKILSPGELYFYQKVYPKLKELQQYIPQIKQIEKNEDGDMVLVSQNLNYGKIYNQLDIKITERYKQKYKYSPMWGAYHINLTGYFIKNEQNEIKEKVNGFYLFLEPVEIIKILDRFFVNKNIQQKIKYVNQIIEVIENLQRISQKYNILFTSSSLLILFDSTVDDLQIKLIDFCHARMYDNPFDSLSIIGLKRFFYDLKTFYENQCE